MWPKCFVFVLLFLRKKKFLTSSTWKISCFILQICPSNFSQCSRSCGVVSFLVISNVQFPLPSNKCALQCVKFGERTIVLKKFSSGRLARFSSSECDDQQCQKSNNLGFPFCFTLFVWKVYKSVAVFPPTHCGGNTDRPKNSLRNFSPFLSKR